MRPGGLLAADSARRVQLAGLAGRVQLDELAGRVQLAGLAELAALGALPGSLQSNTWVINAE